MVWSFLQATAWTMDLPAPYGPFHLILTLLGVSISIFLARKLPRKKRIKTDSLLFTLLSRISGFLAGSWHWLSQVG